MRAELVEARAALGLIAEQHRPDRDPRAAGELSSARVALLDPWQPPGDAPCWQCGAASAAWLAWAGERYGGCPHAIGEVA
jgi:hypothetical protein